MMEKLISKEIIIPNSTVNGKWIVEMSDLTIRVKEFEKNNLMGDYLGCIIADLKPSLGITYKDVENGCLREDRPMSYPNGFGGRQHAWKEVLANAQTICNLMNAARGIK